MDARDGIADEAGGAAIPMTKSGGASTGVAAVEPEGAGWLICDAHDVV